MAVQKLFPEAQVTIGPWIEKGFYYDFDMKEAFTEKDLKKIKKEMVSLLSRCTCRFSYMPDSNSCYFRAISYLLRCVGPWNLRSKNYGM